MRFFLAILLASAAHAFFAPTVRVATARVAMQQAGSEEDKNLAKEVVESAKEEEERLFAEAAVAAATVARSEEALAALRAAGEASATALRADRSELAALLEKKEKAPTKLAKALKKPSGSMALVGEGVKMDTISLGGFDLSDPAYLSGEYRVGGCTAVCVRSEFDENLGEGALKSTTEEQATARGEFPGPLPAILRAPVVDAIQLAAAKADGAGGVVLPLSLNGAEKTGELMAAASDLGMESMVRVCDGEQLEAAMGLDGLKIVVFGDCTVDEAAALLPSLKEKRLVSVADMPTLDVRGAWKVRDAGFNALISGRSMLDLCVRDRVPPTAICKAFLSKGSVKYGLGMQKGRLEGSKEFLGSLAM